MALFQKQPIRQEIVLPYTLSTSATRTVLVVGLGNPGKEHAKQRHNAGFMALDYFAEKNGFTAFKPDKKCYGHTAEATIGTARVILLKPMTFMNDSGRAVQACMQFYKLTTAELIVVHDELSLTFGQIRSRVGGQAAGHNGIKSIISAVDDAFGRVRIGIANERTPHGDTSAFVLSNFNKIEASYLDDVWGEVNGMLTEYIYGGQLPHDTRSIVFDYED